MIYLKYIAITSLWLYVSIILYAILGYIKTRVFNHNENHSNFTPCSILICARNEEAHILKCLQSIYEQEFDFSLIEVLIIDDASTDNTFSIALQFISEKKLNWQLISNENHLGKKKSLSKVIIDTKSDLIITRDADTYTENKSWLKTIVDFHEISGKEFIICPVKYQIQSSLLSKLQHLENFALTILTAGFAFHKKAFLCSGANLAFTKSIFKKVNGYQSHQNIASGDDVLFLEDVKKYNKNSIAYLKQKKAFVTTYPLKTWKEVLHQKIRWASKFGQNPNKFNLFFAILVFFMQFFVLLCLFLPIFRQKILVFSIIFISAKLIIDFLLLFLASRYTRIKLELLWLVPLSFFYSFFSLVTGLLSLFVKPNWK